MMTSMTELAGPAAAPASLERLFRGHYRQLVRLAVLTVDDVDTAEEIVQDSFVEVHRRLAAIDDPLAYLRRSVLNGSRSRLRRRRTVRRHDAREAPPENAPAAELAGVDRITRDTVLTAVASLPDRQRDCVLLRYFVDLSEADIATTLGISQGTVKSSCHRAMQRLAPLLEDLR
jgi:RNA polymerase sigma-70 factor (sigma-E family)